MTESGEYDTELLLEFKIEAEEHLGEVEPAILEMDGCEPERRQDLVNLVFRAVHSVKGASGFFGLTRVQDLSHSMESLLMKVRDGEMSFHPEMVEPLLAGLDKLQALVEALPDVLELPIEDEIADVNAVLASGAPIETEVVSREATDREVLPSPERFGLVVTAKMLNEARCFGQRVLAVVFSDTTSQEDVVLARQKLRSHGEELDFSASGPGPALLAKSVLEAEALEAELQPVEVSIRECEEPTEAVTHPPQQDGESRLRPTDEERKAPQGAGAGRDGETIRVNVRLLDKLMNLAGELVLSRNQLLRGLGTHYGGTTASVLQDLDLITSELQGNIMNTRMQPVGAVFKKFSRIVRDLSRKLDKRTKLVLEGTDVELDKSIIELLSDPLTHLVRNALDHGLETPAAREAAAKDSEGTLWLRAFHEGGQVHIEIEDNGAGIDPERMRNLAVERGSLSRDEASGLSDREARMLIFGAGFSTASEVTDVSGRGVGMDVVKSNIAKLGGKIELDSEVGVGTKVTIRLPLTLAIIPSLIVSSGGERFAVPQVNLVELVRVGTDQADTLSAVQGAEVLPLRGKLLPLVRLETVLGGDHPGATARRASKHRVLTVAVLQVGAAQFGLVVDGVLDSEEIVVKPLARIFDRCRVYAGATIMGDGKVAMILDAAGLAAEAGIEVGDEPRAEALAEATDRRQVIVFSNAPQEFFAVDLKQIVRLEKIDTSEIEQAAGQEYVQYRGSGLPVIRLEDELPVRPLPEDASSLFVLVPRTTQKPHGILVGRVVDTLETAAENLEPVEEPDSAISGRIVLDGRLTLLLDAEHLASNWLGRAA